ncbi:MAG: MarR-like DNA-binding transcriptional regulator SgrR of sgrS sRNA, partial [Myxococcota bacterium]
MRQHPHSFVGASVLGLLVLLTSSVAQSAGRVPYGGRVEAAVQSFDGVDDPHRAASREQRALANLVHTGLFRPNGTGGVTPALAAGLGTLRGRTLTIVLRPARFHGGQAVTSEDVVQSFRRIARLKETALSGLFSVLKITADGRLKVTITMPKGGAAKELRLLLARPEAAVLRRGTPGPQSGCGPF